MVDFVGKYLFNLDVQNHKCTIVSQRMAPSNVQKCAKYIHNKATKSTISIWDTLY